MQQHKILLVIAHEGFQHIEYRTPKKILESAGFHVVTASDRAGTARAKDESTTSVDLTLNMVKPSDYQGIFFIGGPGALECLDNPTSYGIVQQAHKLGVLIGAICIATRILAHANVLKRISATGWDGDEKLTDIYREYGVYYLQQPVVSDQKVVTATGPDTAQAFGQEIVRVLKAS